MICVEEEKFIESIKMNSAEEWKKYERRNYIVRYLYYRRDRLSQSLFGHEYWPLPKREAGRKLLSIEKTNNMISAAIEDGTPFWVGRFGGTEMNVIYEYLKHGVDEKYDNRIDAMDKLCELSGFFPNDIEMGQRFVDLMLQCCVDIDLQAAWGRYMADYIYMKYQPNTILTRLDRIEPWNMYSSSARKAYAPWSSKLAGKKVLVIHPFADTIKEQYSKNRENIFSKIYKADEILPEFELYTIKAVQTLAGEQDSRFNSWFDALQWMVDECRKVDFDVAIIGCGAYGYPLAAEIKKMGKIAIHLAGATQLMFGILGYRWEHEYNYRDFRKNVINDFWVRPNSSEKIVNGDKVENACYW